MPQGEVFCQSEVFCHAPRQVTTLTGDFGEDTCLIVN